QIDEAAANADRVDVLHLGRVVASGHPVELTSRLPTRSISAQTSLDADRLHALPGVVTVWHLTGRAHLTTTAPEAAVRAMLDADPGLHDLRVEAASLEEAVMALTTTSETVAA